MPRFLSAGFIVISVLCFLSLARAYRVCLFRLDVVWLNMSGSLSSNSVFVWSRYASKVGIRECT